MQNTASKVSQSILALLHKRGQGKSICPSEIARELYPSGWRDRMEDIREVARDMAREGEIRITQGDEEIDPNCTIKGPIRLRLPE